MSDSDSTSKKHRPVRLNQKKISAQKQKGQSLVETVVALPLLLALLISFFSFIYEQLWLQVIEHILHEAVICEKTLDEKFCLLTANIEANRYNFFGNILIHRSSNKYQAELFVFKDLKWKTLSIKELPPPN